jgi:uncharacterized cupin superfamily protein
VQSFDLETMALAEDGEYVLGLKDLHTHACYMIYGFLQPGQQDRLVRPGEGHEEILCAVTGSLTLHTTSGDVLLEQGHAVHIKEDASFTISNESDTRCVYIMAGGTRACSSLSW